MFYCEEKSRRINYVNVIRTKQMNMKTKLIQSIRINKVEIIRTDIIFFGLEQISNTGFLYFYLYVREDGSSVTCFRCFVPMNC